MHVRRFIVFNIQRSLFLFHVCMYMHINDYALLKKSNAVYNFSTYVIKTLYFRLFNTFHFLTKTDDAKI